LNGIAWNTVQKMMVDAPSYDADAKEDDIELTTENAESIMNYVNQMM